MLLTYDEIREILIKAGEIDSEEESDTMDLRAIWQKYILRNKIKLENDVKGNED